MFPKEIFCFSSPLNIDVYKQIADPKIVKTITRARSRYRRLVLINK